MFGTAQRRQKKEMNMTALKTLTIQSLIAGGLLVAAGVTMSAPVLADDDYRRGAYDNSRYSNSVRYDRRYDSRNASSDITSGGLILMHSPPIPTGANINNPF